MKRFSLLAFGLLLAAASPAAAQTDVIRGKVTGPENQPLPDVQVTVTTLSGAVSRSARTDQNGRYTVTFPGGDGDYFVQFAAIGYSGRRFEIKRVADEEILIADAKLARGAQGLDAVRVQADRTRPNRTDVTPDIGGSERQVNQSTLAASQLGDLAAMAASLPGVLLVPGADGDPSGFSVLGLSPDQNGTSLNGQNFGGSNLPRDAAVSSSLATSPYDVTRGGFSGGQFNITTRSGTNFIQRASSLNIDNPAMQLTDRAAQSLGQEYSNLSLGGLLSGPIQYNTSYFNTSYQLGRRANDLQTLLNTSPLGLQTSGIAADSVTRLLGTLRNLGVPASVSGSTGERNSDQALLLGQFDIAPPSSRAGSAYGLTVNGSFNRVAPLVNGLTNTSAELPGHGGDLKNWSGGAQFRHSTYFGFGILSETKLGVNASDNSRTPFLQMPSGTVRINSTFDDGTNGVKTVSFGGSPFMNGGNKSSGVAFNNLMSWFSEDNKHRIKLSTELRDDMYSVDNSTNLLGSFAFNSLADLEAGRAASFSRTLTPRKRSGSELVGAVALGDSYRKSNDFQLQYGIRLDGNHYNETPTANPQLEQVFGVRNDHSPNSIYFSPRVGFSWTYGAAPQIAGFDGAFRGPRAVVRGGIGIFQGVPGVQQLGTSIDNTGLPSGVQQVTCAGSATPVPNWSAYFADPSSVPTTCAGGTSGTPFASTAPNVNLFAKDYVAPRSVRGNVNWSGAFLGNRLNALFDLTYSENLNQSGFVDLNFAPTQRFTLAGEGNRPVYVLPTSIDPTTGLVASRDARVSQSYNRVTESRSDLLSQSGQVRASFSPYTFSSEFSWNLSYVYSTVRDRVRGFTNNTVGNPFDVEWARGQFDSHHQIQYGLFYNIADLVRISWNGSFRSGTPFTPLVSGDVNGDGYFNDRAFVFNPNGTGVDATTASSMRSLLDNAPSYVKSCLNKQIGALSARNSCEGPWTAQANLSISFNTLKMGLPQRATISFAVNNPLYAADLLLHGDKDLHGWGQPAQPDQNLLFVRGFDPQTQKFKYDVNQRFGSTSVQNSVFRQPLVVTAMMRFDVGPTREEQSLVQQLNLGRRSDGNKLPEGMIKAIYGNGGGLINPVATILRQSDSLKLSAPQADSLATLNRWYLIRLDSIWSPVAKYLADLPNEYDAGAAYIRYKIGREGTVDLLKKIGPMAKGVLDPAQQRKLPAIVTSYLDPRYLSAIRSGTAGAGGAGLFPGGVGGGPVQIGGGGAVMIMR